MRSIINDISIKCKLIIVSLIVVIVIVIGVVLSIYKLTLNYNKMIYRMTFDNLSFVIEQIEDEMKRIEEFSQYIFEDPLLQSLLSEYSTAAEYRKNRIRSSLIGQLYAYSSSIPYLGGIYLYKDNLMITTRVNNSLSIMSQEKARIEAQKLKGKITWIGAGSNYSNNLLCVRQIREIEDVSLKNLGTLIIEIDFKKLIEEILSQHSLSSGVEYKEIYIYSGEQIIYSKNASVNYSETFKAFKQSRDSFYEIIHMDGESYYLIKKRVDKANLTYIYLTPYKEIYSSIIHTNFTVILIIAIFVVLAITVNILSSKHIINQFKMLIYEMQRFNGEEFIVSYEMETYINRKDEIGDIYRNFNKMAKNISDLINLNLKKEILLKDTEIRMLIQQINPHFLYNTLNSINWMAQMKGAKDISSAVIALSSILRTTIEPKILSITIAKEMEIISQYILLQKNRYQERLEFFSDIHEEVLQKEIPKLCVQALIENSINHVLEKSDQVCFICVVSKIYEDYIAIEVKDNGPGIDENIIEKLERQEIKARNTGIGLINIHKRLQYYYGEHYGLSFRRDTEGGVVVIKLPK